MPNSLFQVSIPPPSRLLDSCKPSLAFRTFKIYEQRIFSRMNDHSVQLQGHYRPAKNCWNGHLKGVFQKSKESDHIRAELCYCPGDIFMWMACVVDDLPISSGNRSRVPEDH